MSEKTQINYVKPELVEYDRFGEFAFGAGASGQAGPGEDMPEMDSCFGVAGLES